MKKILSMLLFLPFTILTKAEGIKFDETSSWADIKAKAQKENKYIFMDCQTTWCGWCRKMEKDVFPDTQLGAFVNANYIAVSVQFDQTAKDNDHIKSWYSDAVQIKKDYPISGYPSFLIFTPDGKIAHRLVGYQPAPDFLAALKKALNPDNQYYSLLRKYEAGEKSPEFLKHFIDVANSSDEPGMAGKVFSDYFSNIKDPYTKDNLTLIAENTRSTQDKGFDLFLNNQAKVDGILGKNASQKMLSKVLMSEIGPMLNKNININLDSIQSIYTTKYPTIDLSKSVMGIKMNITAYKKDWASYKINAIAYMDKYGAEAGTPMLNQIAWTFFEHYTDAGALQKALAWSKKSVEDSQEKDPALLDTYANLLYKSGKKNDAIKWEQKALAIVATDEKGQYQQTLDKMQKGEKTWPDAK